MRISPAGLAVVIAITIPFLVELRTVAAYLNVDLSVTQTILLSILVIGCIVLWAVFPETETDTDKTNEPNGG